MTIASRYLCMCGGALIAALCWLGDAAQAAAQDVPEPAQNPSETIEAAAAQPVKAPRAAALPPCIPAPSASRAHRARRRKPPAQPQGPEPQVIPAPRETPDGMIDAKVGETSSPLASILGKNVESPKGEDLGRVVDVLTDAGGRVRAAIIDFGGFLGVGTRRIAIEWPLLRFDPNARDKAVILAVNREKLQSVPEYKDANKPKLLMPPSGGAPADASDDGHPKQ